MKPRGLDYGILEARGNLTMDTPAREARQLASVINEAYAWTTNQFAIAS